MSSDSQELCQRITRLTSEFADNDEATQALLAQDSAEELLVALALAEAFIKGLVILEPKALAHIRSSEEELREILAEYADSEEEDEE